MVFLQAILHVLFHEVCQLLSNSLVNRQSRMNTIYRVGYGQSLNDITQLNGYACWQFLLEDGNERFHSIIEFAVWGVGIREWGLVNATNKEATYVSWKRTDHQPHLLNGTP